MLGVPVLIAGVVLATPWSAGAATADGKPIKAEKEPFSYIPADQRARFEQQKPIVAAAQRLRDRIEAGPHRDFTGVALTETGVDVYWKGRAPARVRAMVGAQQLARLRPADYSLVELKAAEKDAMDRISHTDGPVYGVRVPADGSGLVAMSSTPLSTARARTFTAQVSRRSAVPVSLEVAPAPSPQLRQDDFAPYYGGGRITNPGGSWCSSGFGVYRGSTQYILTAGHCGWPGGLFKNGDATRTVGTGALENVGHDILLVAASATGRIWDGGGTRKYETRGQFTKAVSSWGDAFPNEWVCQSGMTSGAQCNIQNSNNFSYSYTSGGETYSDLVMATSNGGIASRPGDSGGPVFTLDGAKVRAKGTISGGGTSYPIKIGYNGKCLDADANNLNRNGTRIQLWDCNGSTQQNFVFYPDGSIRSATNTGYCLDADLNTIANNGTTVQLWSCNGSNQQQWKFNGSTFGPIQSIYNNRCLDAHLGAINTNGDKVQLWDCNNSGQQSWGPQTRVLYQDFRTAVRDFGIGVLTQ